MSDSINPKSYGAWIAGAVLILFSAAAILADLLFIDPLTQQLDHVLAKPLQQGFLLGTDHLGRDILSRLMYGGRTSLLVSLGSSGIAIMIGAPLGMIAAIDKHRGIDRALQLINDSILAFPTILLAIAVAAVFQTGRSQVMWTLGVVFSPVLFRITRSEARKIIHREYYLVSQLLQTPRLIRTILHLIPNIAPPVLIQSASLAAIAIGTEAALSFLGLGAQPPEPSWGLMLSDSRRYLSTHVHLSLIPGIAAGLLAFSFQYLSDQMAAAVTALEE
jgi:ABC-type dipeptide/oligopeptide/nickel transport system permease subunit